MEKQYCKLFRALSKITKVCLSDKFIATGQSAKRELFVNLGLGTPGVKISCATFPPFLK